MNPPVRYREPGRLGRPARLVPWHFAFGVPDVEACDVELDPASRCVNPLHHHLGFGHDLPAAIAGFPVARTTPDAWDMVVGQTPIRELFLDHETQGVPFHESPRRVQIRHARFTGVSTPAAPTRKARVQATALCAAAPSMSIGPWYAETGEFRGVEAPRGFASYREAAEASRFLARTES
jgi:hypothetical protein